MKSVGLWFVVAGLCLAWPEISSAQGQPAVTAPVLDLDGKSGYVELPPNSFTNLNEATVEAWVKCRNGTAAAKAEARARFLAPLYEHLEHAGLGHVSEVADGDPPHAPGGCPFQAWSVSELIRLERQILAL